MPSTFDKNFGKLAGPLRAALAGQTVTPSVFDMMLILGRDETIARLADVNAKGPGGETPLHSAAFEGHKEIAELLIAKGADVNAKKKDKIGLTPLHIAAVAGHKEVAELLIAKGADINTKNDFGETPLDAAILFKSPELADLLRKHGGKTGEELKAGN